VVGTVAVRPVVDEGLEELAAIRTLPFVVRVGEFF